jgi:selenocysteine lyase/cysteine desulfurase
MDISRRRFLATAGLATAAAAFPGRLVAEVRRRTPPLPDLARWSDVRALFPLAPGLLHFTSFYLVSHPRPVRDAIDAFRAAIDANPLLTIEHRMFTEQSVLLEVCNAAAAYVGGKPDEIALTPNTTTGLALVYHGLPFAPGDEILVTTHDHYVHHEAVRTATLRAGAKTRRVALYEDPARVSVDGVATRLARALTPSTRVVGVTWVHSSTGVRLPIRAIAEVLKAANAQRDPARRILLVVDGVHGFGCVDEPAAALGADFFCAGTHKWLFAPRGTGIVWAPADRWARVRPTIPSFASLALYEAWAEGKEPGPTTALEFSPGGFLAYEHQWAMTAAFQLHEQLGRARVAKRIAQLNDQLKQGLAKMPRVRLHTPLDPALSAGIVCFEVEGVKPETVVEKLLAKKIVASTSPYKVTYARLAPSLVNDEREVEAALRAVREIAAT